MQCTAHTRSGKACGNHALPGASVCRMHGGKAPQVQRAATRTLAVRRAERMVQAAGVDMDPIAHLLDCLHRAHGLMLAYGTLVAELQDEELTRATRLGELKPHPFVVLHEQAIERRGRLAKLCVDAGVAEKQIALAERMGEQLSAIFERVIGAIGGLSVEQRGQAVLALAREVRLLEPGVVEGTVAA